jgi:hypothetical protein
MSWSWLLRRVRVAATLAVGVIAFAVELLEGVAE